MLKFRVICFAICLLLCLPLFALAQDANEELLEAARKSDVEKVKTLLAKGANVNAKSPYGVTPLGFACSRGSVEIVKLLLDSGAEVNVTDTFYKTTPFGMITMGKNAKPEIMQMMLEKGAKYELLATNPIGEVMMATPAISDGMLFIRGQKHLFAIAEKAAAKEAAAK